MFTGKSVFNERQKKIMRFPDSSYQEESFSGLWDTTQTCIKHTFGQSISGILQNRLWR